MLMSGIIMEESESDNMSFAEKGQVTPGRGGAHQIELADRDPLTNPLLDLEEE